MTVEAENGLWYTDTVSKEAVRMEILYADREIAVVVKPVGLDSEHELPSALEEQLGGTTLTVHRLDRGVGGVMVYARTKAAAAALSKAITDGTMVKEYVAEVHGTPPAEGELEDLLFKDSRKNKVFVVKRERRGVKKAKLSYRTVRAGDRSTVAVRLFTGRSHQIRVQFASRGYPLVGDRKYGAKDSETGLRLFSCRLTFPYKGEERSFEAYPDWFTKV